MTFFNALIDNSTVKFPDKEAVVCGERRLTYSELRSSSLQLAGFLVSKGIKKGDRIGIFCSKDVDEVIVILAALKIGAVFVYLNPMFREDQAAHVICSARIKMMFIDQAKARILKKIYPAENPFSLIVSVSRDDIPGLMGDEDNHNLGQILRAEINPQEFENIDDDDPAAIIYTSGSTGKSKGIVVTHKIFYDSSEASIRVLNNSQDDRLISVTPFSFDGALSQLFTMLMSGGTLVQQRSNFPKDIVETLLVQRITGFHAMPSLWNILLQRHSPFKNYRYPDLRYISLIGETLPAKYLEIIRDTLKETKIYKMYGTTEAFRSTFLPPEDLYRKSGSVGVPFPGVEISIVDEDDRVCEPGETGEIVHRGNFISPGYWNLPEESIERFRSDGLHTGDLGRMDEEGYLYFAGRKDGMMKIQGFRVSPGEIEECILELDNILETVVMSIPGENLDMKIKAVVVCRDKNISTEKEIIRHCRNKLPGYMVPSVVEFRESLPRTASNKINKMELL